MIHDLLSFAKDLEVALGNASAMMWQLKPKFILVGSVSEGTRIGLGNELDITIEFEGWNNSPPLVAGIDAVHLHREDLQANCNKRFTDTVKPEFVK